MILRLPCFLGRELCTTIAPGLAAAILVVAFPVVSWAQEPFPKKISGIKMGDSMSAVIDMVKDAGTYESTPGDEIQRPSLTWLLPNNPYYKQMSFKFTEKDRLYLIRFDLKNITRSDLRAMKKTLFDMYGISWDDPWKLKVKGQDVLLYGPPEMGRIYYFEFFEPKTGERAYELLERVMSAEDRPVKKKDEKTGDTDTDRGPKEDTGREGTGLGQDERQASGEDKKGAPSETDSDDKIQPAGTGTP